jgi:uncharacterized protein YjbI with pentapeptide repeats
LTARAQAVRLPPDRTKAAQVEHAHLTALSAAELARLVEEHRKWLAAMEGGGDYDGARAVFEGRALRGAALAEADLRHAVFTGSDLTGADLSGAELEYADFTGAVLQDTRLHEADLVNATLADAKSLSSKSLAGAILTNVKLPDEVAKFDGLDRTWEIASRASNTFIGLLAACAYSWLAIATTTDPRLLTNSATSPLPIIGTEIPIVGFFWAAPVILLGAHLYVHIYLQRLWQGYARLPAVFPDGMALDQKAYPWLLSSLVQFNVRRLRGRQRLSTCVDHILCVILAWWVVPFTLAMFWLRYLPRHDWAGTIWHILLITIAAAASLVTYRLAQRTLRQIAHPAPDTYVGEERSAWGHAWRMLFRYRPSRTQVGIAVMLALLSVAAITGAPNRRGGDFPEVVVPEIFRGLGYRTYADFRNAEVSLKPEGWSLNDELTEVAGATLEDANLQYADGRKSFLVNANLRSADLTGADMKKANLDGSDMDESIMAGADFNKASLANVNLEEADLRGATLTLVDFTGSILTRAKVEGANFNGAVLDQTRFDQTDLSGALNLSREQLARACADKQPTMPPGLADLVLPPCPVAQGERHRIDN